MIIPDNLIVQVVMDPNSQPVMGAVILIKLLMPLKNSYGIGPKITGEDGTALFTKGEIMKELGLCQTVSPMDYCGTIEDCLSIQISVLGRDDIQRLVDARKMWGQGVPELKLNEQEIAALRSAQNNPVFANSLRIGVDERTLQRGVVLRLSGALVSERAT